MRFVSTLGLAALLALGSSAPTLRAQDSAAIVKQINDEFSLTKVTDDRSDIVTAGAVVVLHKDGLMMYSTPTTTPPLNVYKDGKLQQNVARDYLRGIGGLLKKGASDTSELNNIPHRRFVAGEKFWITAINFQADGVVFNVYSDPFNDVRYYGQLKFPFAKNSPPPPTLAKTVEEVITVQPSDDDKNQKADEGAPKGGTPGGTQSASAPLAPIAPPPPPADQPAAAPKTISVGQTKDVVVANWGQPTKTVKLSGKEIYYYPDMKVTFVAGKVSDVQ